MVVGPRYYEQAVGPLFLIFILLMALCPLSAGGIKSRLKDLSHQLIGLFALAIALYLCGVRSWYALLSFPLLGLVIWGILSDWIRGIRERIGLKKEPLFLSPIRLF